MFNAIPGHTLVVLILLQRCSRCILEHQLIGPVSLFIFSLWRYILAFMCTNSFVYLLKYPYSCFSPILFSRFYYCSCSFLSFVLNSFLLLLLLMLSLFLLKDYIYIYIYNVSLFFIYLCVNWCIWKISVQVCLLHSL